MTSIVKSLRRASALVGALLMTALLSGCLVSSSTNLVSDDEAVMPFDSAVTVWTYKYGEGGYVPSGDPAITLQVVGKTYDTGGSGDGHLVLHFVPRDGDDAYLLAVTGDGPGAFYGATRLKDGIIAMHLILGGNVDTAITAAKSTAPADVAADLTVSEGAITVTRRETLDYVMGLLESGAIEADPMLSFASTDPNATPPALIIRDGDWYKVQ